MNGIRGSKVLPYVLSAKVHIGTENENSVIYKFAPMLSVAQSNKIAYLAGIIDGEGSIQTYPALVIKVSNTDLSMIEWLQNNFGGKVYKIKTDPKYKQAYLWTLLKKKEVLFLLSLVLPFLIIKKPLVLKELKFHAKTKK